MLKGFMKLKNAAPGSLVRFADGNYALITEYYRSETNKFDAFLYATGEALHANPDEWVAVIDLAELELVSELFEQLAEYPDGSSGLQDE